MKTLALISWFSGMIVSVTFSQTIVNLEPFVPITTDTISEFANCSSAIEVTVGTEIGFTFGSGCTPNIRIDSEFPSGVGSSNSMIITGTDPSVTFTSEGQYFVFCNVGGPGKEIATMCLTATAASTVTPSATVPTVGQWGVITLLLTLCILGIAQLKEQQLSSMKY